MMSKFLAAFVALFLVTGCASDAMMKKDTMKKDTMMKKDEMKKDAMMKKDEMKKDKMSK